MQREAAEAIIEESLLEIQVPLRFVNYWVARWTVSR